MKASLTPMKPNSMAKGLDGLQGIEKGPVWSLHEELKNCAKHEEKTRFDSSRQQNTTLHSKVNICQKDVQLRFH